LSWLAAEVKFEAKSFFYLYSKRGVHEVRPIVLVTLDGDDPVGLVLADAFERDHGKRVPAYGSSAAHALYLCTKEPNVKNILVRTAKERCLLRNL